jgi:hypothetical protein
MTIILAGASIITKQARQTQPWNQVTLSMGNTVISYDASVVINKKAKYKQEKQAQPHDTCNGCHARDTRSTNSADKLTGSARDTVPNKTKQVQGTTTANTILVDSTQKNECGSW